MYSTFTITHQSDLDSPQGSEMVTALASACSALEVLKIGHRVGAIHTHCVISRGEDGSTRLQYMETRLDD